MGIFSRKKNHGSSAETADETVNVEDVFADTPEVDSEDFFNSNIEKVVVEGIGKQATDTKILVATVEHEESDGGTTSKEVQFFISGDAVKKIECADNFDENLVFKNRLKWVDPNVFTPEDLRHALDTVKENSFFDALYLLATGEDSDKGEVLAGVFDETVRTLTVKNLVDVNGDVFTDYRTVWDGFNTPDPELTKERIQAYNFSVKPGEFSGIVEKHEKRVEEALSAIMREAELTDDDAGDFRVWPTKTTEESFDKAKNDVTRATLGTVLNLSESEDFEGCSIADLLFHEDTEGFSHEDVLGAILGGVKDNSFSKEPPAPEVVEPEPEPVVEAPVVEPEPEPEPEPVVVDKPAGREPFWEPVTDHSTHCLGGNLTDLVVEFLGLHDVETSRSGEAKIMLYFNDQYEQGLVETETILDNLDQVYKKNVKFYRSLVDIDVDGSTAELIGRNSNLFRSAQELKKEVSQLNDKREQNLGTLADIVEESATEDSREASLVILDIIAEKLAGIRKVNFDNVVEAAETKVAFNEFTVPIFYDLAEKHKVSTHFVGAPGGSVDKTAGKGTVKGADREFETTMTF